MFGQDYTRLMTRKIRSILLICNNYDSFSLEEDGHIEGQISQDYAELNLSNPPSIDRVESTLEALELLKHQGDRYDLIITMFNVGKLDVFEFSRLAKVIAPHTPIVLLSSYSKVIYNYIAKQDKTNIDYVFSWNNSTDLIIAIIKLLEDKMNAEHDVLEMGVRTIMLVEDSVHYYSAYLPILYKLVLRQNNEAVRDALNEEQQFMRKRARPKIMLATCYDEAVELYQKYKTNMLGIISDVGFILHKGDDRATEVIDAGINLCRLIKADNPTLPYLLQSSQESMRSVAEELGVGFVRKTSKTLIHELSEYIAREFAFGDFIVTDPMTGQETARARNLYEFERLIKTMSDESLRYFAGRNYISRWLYSRGLFSIGDSFRDIDVNDETDLGEIRKLNLRMLHDYRMRQGLGVVARFDPATYNDAIWFSRLGDGSLGGKARGLAFLNHILSKYDLYGKWEDVRVLVPRTLVVTTEYFDRFILENGLQYVINSDLSDAEILSEFVASTLPPDLTDALRVFIRNVRRPLAVRSSSILEDSYYQPFAGVYSTYMIPHTENEDQELRLLSKAIKSVYASVYFASSRGYIISTSNVISEEKMAIVLQEVCGSEDGGYYFPTFSGVARSINFYPIGYETPEDGVAKLAFGLGKAVVDGDQVLRFSPKYPKNVLQTSTPDLTMRETQQAMFALNLQPDKFKTSVDDAVNLERIPISDCGRFRSFSKVVSTWDYENQRIVDSPVPKGPKFVTFAHILKYNTFPLADILNTLLEITRKEVKCAVEIEFAADLDRGDRAALFNVLQIRPITSVNSFNAVDWNSLDTEGALISSGCAIGPGMIQGVRDVVYLRRQNFDVMKTREMAAEMTAINNRMRDEGRNYVLIGYGRWGSSIPSLGVPVQWSNISEAKVIVECCLENFRIDPSQGTHFFQNMTSFNAGYVNVNPYSRPGEYCDLDALDSMPAEYESDFVRIVHFPEDLTVCIDGKENRALVKA
ncbi:MAG: phosphoenolpyruvate synthase [Bacteroidetes bacterium]|uniref:Phosphoenolpyruvate synthase n=1 Tax=Candidatus Cryptobacteroides avistercoris TaxID=2840758 RepID=A0A9D9IX33_9BACT|nr:phosphoenolpyruvate synthase [Candidatus Cryptobacteroides avistercoris]